MFKRIGSIVLTVVMMLSMLCTFSVVSADGVMTLTYVADKETAERGDEIKVTVGVTNYAPVKALGFDATYDSELLEYVAAEFTTTAYVEGVGNITYSYYSDTGICEQKTDNPNVLTTAWMNGQGNIKQNEEGNNLTLCILKFKVKADATIDKDAIFDFAFIESTLVIENPADANKTLPLGTELYTTETTTESVKIVCAHEYDNQWKVLPDTDDEKYATHHAKVCSKCGDTQYEKHNLVDTSTTDTCNGAGSVGKKCTICGYNVSTEVDEIKNHNWGETTTTGLEHKHLCTNDNGCTAEAVSFNASGIAAGYGTVEKHDETCDADAYDVYVCKVEGCTYSFVYTYEGTALDHDYEWTHEKDENGEWYHSAECTRTDCDAKIEKTACDFEYTQNAEDGTHTATCKVCKDAEGAPFAITDQVCVYEENTKQDCETDATDKCTKCGDVVAVPDGEHTGHNVPTVGEGKWEYIGNDQNKGVCQNGNCPAKDNVVIKKCEYDNGKYVAPGCETRGKTVYTCQLCGHEKEVIDNTAAGNPTGHKFNYVHNVDANGNHTHSSNGACLNNCGKVVTNERCNITTVNPTCTKDGSESCSICKYYKVLKADGKHPEDQIVIMYKAPSIVNGGYIQLTCQACNGKLDYEKNAALAQGLQYKDLNYKNEAEANNPPKTNSWFYDEAIFAKSFGLMQGEYDYFNGNKEITRGQVVTVLGRYLWGRLEDMSVTEYNALIKSLGGDTKSFVDLKGEYFDRYAIALSTIGVVNGIGNTFQGNENVTREQLAAFFLRYINYIEPGSNKIYSDKIDTMTDLNTLSDWAKKEGVDRAAKIGIISGMNNKFNPQGTATRAQMATIMERIVRAHSEYPIVDVE